MTEYLNIKRCYLPFIVKVTCPKCGVEGEWDLADQYISEPAINEWESHWQYCQECEHEWSVKGMLSVSFELKD